MHLPAQPLLGPATFVDEIITMINQHLDLAVHPLSWLRPRHVRLAQSGPRHRERVEDRVQLPAHPSGPTFRHRQLRRDPHNSSPSPSSCRSIHGVNSRQSSIAHSRSASSTAAQPMPPPTESALPTARSRRPRMLTLSSGMTPERVRPGRAREPRVRRDGRASVAPVPRACRAAASARPRPARPSRLPAANSRRSPARCRGRWHLTPAITARSRSFQSTRSS